MSTNWIRTLHVYLISAIVMPSCKPHKIEDPKDQRRQPDIKNPIAAGPLGPIEDTVVKGAPVQSQSQPISDFVFPLPGGTFGSAWCVCRSIGTSPHIGQDITTPAGDQISVSVAEANVTKVAFDSSCGYSVELVDTNGAKWIYRHCDQPFVSEGSSISTGQKVCKHERWPTSGCGTGPHLHLERRSASKAIPGDREHGKSCEFGYNTCYFDPTVIKKQPHSNNQRSASLASSEASEVNSNIATNELHSSIEHSVSKRRSCQGYGQPLETSLESEIKVGNDLIAEFNFPEPSEGIRILNYFELRHPKDALGTNICEQSETSQNCLQSFQIFGKEKSLSWVLIAESTGLRNAAIRLDSKSGICINADLSEILVIAKTPEGKQLSKVFPNF